MCPSMITGEKDGASGDNTNPCGVSGWVGLVVCGVTGEGKVSDGVVWDGDGGTHGSAHSDELWCVE